MNISEKKLHLESLRGIAALSVMLFHYALGFMHHTLLQSGFTDNAALMVDFFFVLSGYVIALNYCGRLGNWSQVASFQWKRFLRLYPLHLVMLLAFLAFQMLKYAMGFVGIGEQVTILDGNMTWTNFVSNLFLVQVFTGELSWNFPAWSISAEFYTYLLFAVWMMIYVRMPRLGLLLAAAIVGASAFQIYQTSMRSTSNGYVRCFMSFFIGAGLVGIERRCRIPSSNLLAGAVLVATVVYVSMATGYPNWAMMLAPVLFGALILLLNALPAQAPIIRVLSVPLLVFLGTISYGVYMIHALVASVAMSVVNHVFKWPLVEIAASDSRVLDLSPGAVTLFELCVVAIVIGLAWLSYRYVELPAVRWGQRIAQGTAPGARSGFTRGGAIG